MPNDEELLQVEKRIKEILPYDAVKGNLDMIIDMVKPIIEKQERERIGRLLRNYQKTGSIWSAELEKITRQCEQALKGE